MHAKAVAHTDLAESTVVSVLDVLTDFALHGIQVYYYLENGSRSTLAHQHFMQWLPPPKEVNYCQYRILNGRPDRYPSPKPTKIWTNASRFVGRVCPGREVCGHWARIAGASGVRPKFFGWTDQACRNWLPEELHSEILEACERV